MALKKQWYEILAPKMFSEKVIGETLAVDSKNLVNRKLQVNITELDRNNHNYFVKLNFRVENVEGTKAYTRLVGHDVMTERIYRMVRRRSRRVDTIQDVTTKDNRKLRIKIIFVLIRRINTSVKKAVRRSMEDLVAADCASMDLEDLMKTIISGKFQEKLKKQCSKIYPIGGLEVRKTEIAE